MLESIFLAFEKAERIAEAHVAHLDEQNAMNGFVKVEEDIPLESQVVIDSVDEMEWEMG
jgi:hypothetical protein